MHRIEPLLYRVLTINDESVSLIFAADAKPATFIQNAVRHVFLGILRGRPTWETKKKLFSKCSKAINVLMDGQIDSDLYLLLDIMHPQKLSICLPAFPLEWDHSTLSRPFFLSVTHLELFQPNSDELELPIWDDWSRLASLPSLTHLCVSQELGVILPHAIRECPRLAVGIIAFWGYEAQDGMEFTEGLTWGDPRLVVMVMVIDSFTEDWELGARGGDDFWARADAFIARKRVGEIESKFAVV